MDCKKKEKAEVKVFTTFLFWAPLAEDFEPPILNKVSTHLKNAHQVETWQ